MPVESPFELLEMEDGETRVFHIERWEMGTTRIFPPFAPEGKDIPVLRIWVAPGERPIGLDYWDITSKTLIAQLLPHLRQPTFRARRFTIKAFGVRPRKRFTVEVVPEAPGVPA